MRDDTSAPDPQANGFPYQARVESNEPIGMQLNLKAAAMRTYQLELQASGHIAMLPAYTSMLLYILSGQIDPDRLPRLLIRVSEGWVSEETGKSLGHARRALFHLKRLGFIAVIQIGGGSEESLYELLPVSAQARTVSAQARRARKRAICAQMRVYKAQARTVTGRACAQPAGDTLLENCMLSDYSNSTSLTTKGMADADRVAAAAVLEKFGIEKPKAAELVTHPMASEKLARAAIIQAKKAKGISNPPGLAIRLMQKPEKIHAGNLRLAELEMAAAQRTTPAAPPAIDPERQREDQVLGALSEPELLALVDRVLQKMGAMEHVGPALLKAKNQARTSAIWRHYLLSELASVGGRA